MVRTGMMRAFGTALKQIAQKSQGRIAPAFGGGLVVALLLQSSTATAMIVSSFSGQGVMSVSTALIAILGADVGTAIAVIVASQKLTLVSPILLAVGIFGFIAVADDKKRNMFRALAGLGMVLLALDTIGDAAQVMSSAPDFRIFVGLLESNPSLLFIAAIVITYLAHSSLAIVLLGSGLVASGLIQVEGGVMIVLGANVGGGLLPVVASWHSTANARIPVLANLMIRSSVVIALVPVIGLAISYSSIVIPEAAIPYTLHLVVNILVAVVGIIFAHPILNLLGQFVPKPTGGNGVLAPKHLDPTAIKSPTLALAYAKREALHMAEIAQKMLALSMVVLRDNDEAARRRVVAMDDDVDTLYSAIKLYVVDILQQNLTETESQQAMDLLGFTTNIEHVGDILDGSLMDLASKKIEKQIQFSPDGLKEITSIHAAVNSNFDMAINTFVSSDSDLAKTLYSAKEELRFMEQRSIVTHLNRISAGVPSTLGTSSLHLDVIRDLKRVNSHLTSIAHPILDASGQVLKRHWKPQKALH